MTIKKYEKLLKQLKFKNEKEALKFEIIKIHFEFTQNIIDYINKNNITKLELSKVLNISKRKVIKLLAGDGLINFKLLARFQRYFKVNFNIKLTKNKNYDIKNKEFIK